jgi:ubiquinone/menaquinone biosynthesis C-methylase UbiE
MTAITELLDELALAGPEHLDPSHVASYDRKSAFDADADIALLRERGLGTQSTLIDFGAGTGVFALAAARVVGHVIAVDVSDAMLAALGAKAKLLGIENIDHVRAGFLSYRHDGSPVDFVYSRNALHHLPDFWKAIALRRITEFLRPAGVLLLRDLVFAFEPHEAEQVLGAWLEAAPDDPAEGWTREEYKTHLREEHSTFSWLLEPMLVRAGLTIEDATYDPRRVYAAYVCRKRD